jgi:hypothetical protein
MRVSTTVLELIKHVFLDRFCSVTVQFDGVFDEDGSRIGAIDDPVFDADAEVEVRCGVEVEELE